MSETTQGLTGSEGGEFAIPAAVRQLVINLQQRSEATLAHRREKLSSLEGDESFAVEVVALSTYVEELLKASRTVVNAYSHAIANPRPSLQRLAFAQEITPSNLRRRYTSIHVLGVTELLQESPSIDVIQHAFPVVADMDLKGISTRIDHEVSMRLELRAACMAGSLDLLSKVLSPERAREVLLREGRVPPHYGPTGSNGDFEFERMPLGRIGREVVMNAAGDLGSEHVEYAQRELAAFYSVSNDR